MILDGKKRKAFFCMAALCAISAYSIKNLSVACVPAARHETCSVEFEWFGMDAKELERLVAVPLEEKLRSLENLITVATSCEYSKCVANATFLKGKKSARFAASAAAQEVFQTLPKDVQRPRVYESSSESKWLFCAAFDQKERSLNEIEKALKGRLEKIPGVSQCVFSGGRTKEIQLAFDGRRMSFRGKAPWDAAAALQEQNAKALFGESLSYSQQPQSAAQIRGIGQLRDFCEAREGLQKQNSIVRINGRECVLTSLKSSDASKNMAISRAARKILKSEFPHDGDFQIVFDNGREQEKLLRELFAALFQSLLALAAAVLAFYRSAKKTAAILTWTGAVSLFSLAAMSALKIPLDGPAISGLALSLGLLCDPALYMADDCKSSLSAMTVASLTTICAALCLCALDFAAPGAKNLSLACVLALGISTVLALVFLPIFFEKKAEAKPKARNFLNLYLFSYKPPRKRLKLYSFLYIIPPAILVFSPKNLKSADLSPVICGQVEYEPARSLSSIDEELLPFVEKVKKIKGVEFVQSEAMRGRAEIQIAAKSAKAKNRICEECLKLGGLLSGSLYLPLSPPKRKIVQSVQVFVLGPDGDLCRRLAREAAAELAKKRFAGKNNGRLVLNFKDDERVFVAKPDKRFLAQNGLCARDFAHALRWCLFGGVAQKAFLGQERLDIRAGQKDFCFGNGTDLDGFKSGMTIKGLPMDALCRVEERKRPSKTYRKDGSAAAAFSIEIESDKSDKIFKEVRQALKETDLPQGYFFDFPREYQNLGLDWAKVFGAFSLALFAIYVLIAAQCERPLDALKALATIPLSLFLPLALRAATFCPLTFGDAVGMVFVSGLCVNNALYIMAEFNLNGRKNARAAARAVLKSCLSSSATTIACALPLAFFGSGGFSSDLAFFTLFGTLGSLAASLVFFPEMLDGGATTKKGGPLRQEKAARF